MLLLKFPFRVLYKTYFGVFFFITLTLAYPIFKFLFYKEKRFPAAIKFTRAYAKFWLIGSGIFLTIKGKENLKTNRGTLVCSNHSSFLDIPCLYIAIADYFIFTGKKEISKWPILGLFYTSGMNILVDRDNPNGDMAAMKRMMQVVDKDQALFVFPEGTISRQAPKMTDFKLGAVTLAIRKQVPIQPITFTTNWKRLQRKNFFTGKASPGIAKMIIHPPISTEGLNKKDVLALQEKLIGIINEPLKEMYGV